MRWLVSSHWVMVYSCCLLATSISSIASADESSSQSTIRTLDGAQPGHLQTQVAPVATTPPEKTLSSSATQQRTASVPAFPRPGIPSPAFSRPLVESQVTNQTRQALDFYGGYAARATLSQLPRRTPVHTSAPQPMQRQVKPFHTVYHEPAVSPYLNLYREESDTEAAPNYFAFVRPQLEQIEANRTQQREIQKLRGQMQGGAIPVGGSQNQPTSTPGTRVSARYMDTAQFYGGWRR